MDKGKIQRILKRLKQAFESQNIKIDCLIVFGSQVFGQPHSDSDLILLSFRMRFQAKEYSKGYENNRSSSLGNRTII